MKHMGPNPKASLLIKSTPDVRTVAEDLAKDDFQLLFESPRDGDTRNNNLIDDH